MTGAEYKRAQRAVYFMAAALLLFGLYRIVDLAWVGDDAFISFRYAENLISGHGLVFNAGEYVEGYTNFLWTMLIAAGLLLGADPILLTHVLSIASALAIVALCALVSARTAGPDTKRSTLAVPITALALLVHHDFAVYATSGLETMFLTALIMAAFFALTTGSSERSVLLGGILMTLAALTRPDALLFVGMVVPYLLLSSNRRVRSGIIYLAPVILVYLPYWLWRYDYYGFPFPNTYYAKSGNLTYYSQGLFYVWLFLKSYYVLLLAVPAAIVSTMALTREFRDKRLIGGTRSKATLLALLFVGPYLFYVIRIGGDFMFARFLIPVLPLMIFLIEAGITSVTRSTAYRVLLTIVVVAGVLLRWYPFGTGTDIVQGVADEREHYPADLIEDSRREGEILRRYLGDKNVVVGFHGMRAMLMYYSRLPVAIECGAGLTDEYIAHLPLTTRGRIGHEKQAPHEYLIRRRTNFLFRPRFSSMWRPEVVQSIQFDEVRADIVIYDRALMDQLKQYPGVVFTDFPRFVDEHLGEFEHEPLEVRRQLFEFCVQYYFHHNDDPERYDRLVRMLSGSDQ